MPLKTSIFWELFPKKTCLEKAAYKIKQTNQVLPSHSLHPELVVEEAGELHHTWALKFMFKAVNYFKLFIMIIKKLVGSI